jgi:basic amino acid/polyamine antiporter, APA family
MENPAVVSSGVYTEGSSRAREAAAPKPLLSLVDAVALIVGIVVGAGIFSLPSLVAANSANSTTLVLAWILGGVVTLIGALCYAELATTFPSAGGDYHFLTKAYGRNVSFLFAWARASVIQTGTIAIPAFIFGDYFSQFVRLGEYSAAIWAALAVIALTAINIAGITLGTGAQKLLTALEVLGVAAIVVVGLLLVPAAQSAPPETATNAPASASFGLAMVFVLYTYGGWNEAAYISAELRDGRKRMAQALIIGIVIITALFLLVNLAYLNALGLSGMAGSQAVASDTMRRAFGDGGAQLIALIVAISALTSANATIFTGARTNYALGRDFTNFSFMGRWNERASAPVNAFIVQGLIALALIGLGVLTRKGFQTIVDYTAPVFWFFFLLTGIGLFVLRYRYPNVERPFRVPLYPVTPILFCLSSAYLLYSSLAYTGYGALVGVGVLAVGAILLLFLTKTENPNVPPSS